MATPATTKSNKPAQVAPLAAAKAAAIVKASPSPATTKVAKDLAASAETKAQREHRATREVCATVRKELAIGDKIVKAKANDTRNGSLRHNIVNAIQSAKTVGAACESQVTGGKYTTDAPYTVKKTDVGFALGNGYITVTK